MSNILLPHNNISIISQEASETWKLYIGKVVNKKRWEMEMLCRAPARKKLKLCHQYSVTYKTNSFIWWEAYTWILQSFIHSKSEDVHIGLNIYKSPDINRWPYNMYKPQDIHKWPEDWHNNWFTFPLELKRLCMVQTEWKPVT